MLEDGAAKVKENPVSLEIVRARSSDLAIIWGIIEECSQWLSIQNINHWTRYYTEEMVSKMIEKKEVYVGLNNNEAISTITLDNIPPKYYSEPGYEDRFTNPDESAIYITAVAVLPAKQKQGFAGQLLDFAEDKARKAGTKWLRLDCRAEVPGLVTFYEKRGFNKLGDKPVDEGEDGTYWLMEKELL